MLVRRVEGGGGGGVGAILTKFLKAHAGGQLVLSLIGMCPLLRG